MREGRTFRKVVEAALRLFLKAHREEATPFRLRKHSFRGQGVVEGLSEGNWQEMRWRAYERRGAKRN